MAGAVAAVRAPDPTDGTYGRDELTDTVTSRSFFLGGFGRWENFDQRVDLRTDALSFSLDRNFPLFPIGNSIKEKVKVK